MLCSMLQTRGQNRSMPMQFTRRPVEAHPCGLAFPVIVAAHHVDDNSFFGHWANRRSNIPLSLQPRLTSVLVVQEDLAHFPRLSQKKCTYHCDQCVSSPDGGFAPNKGVLLKHGARLLALSGRHGRALPTDHGP